MTALALTVTNAGQTAFTQAQLDDDIDLAISAVGFTAANFVVAPTLTALPGEFKRVATISGLAVDDATIHLTVRDSSVDTFSVRGFALYLADGTLFAVYGQAGPIVEKSTASTILLALDIKFPPGMADEIQFGDANFAYPPASETVKGVAELATQAEVDVGDDHQRIVTPRTLKARIQSWLAARSISAMGLATGGGTLAADRTISVAAASAAEADAGAIATKALTPASLVNILAAIGDRVIKARQILVAGLATGGGTLAADRTITVAAADAVELRAAVEAGKAVTPAAFGGLGRSRAQDGYETLPGGLIIQWGRFTASANGTTAVVFAVPFPTACFAVVSDGTSGSGNDSQDNFPGIVSSTITAAGFSVFSADNTADGCCFIAIGH